MKKGGDRQNSLFHFGAVVPSHSNAGPRKAAPGAAGPLPSWFATAPTSGMEVDAMVNVPPSMSDIPLANGSEVARADCFAHLFGSRLLPFLSPPVFDSADGRLVQFCISGKDATQNPSAMGDEKSNSAKSVAPIHASRPRHPSSENKDSCSARRLHSQA